MKRLPASAKKSFDKHYTHSGHTRLAPLAGFFICLPTNRVNLYLSVVSVNIHSQCFLCVLTLIVNHVSLSAFSQHLRLTSFHQIRHSSFKIQDSFSLPFYLIHYFFINISVVDKAISRSHQAYKLKNYRMCLV